MSFAVIKTGGKQYLVSKGDKVKVEKVSGKEGGKITFDSILATGDDKTVTAGTPTVSGAKVEGTIKRQGRTKKVSGVKFKNKTRSGKSFGHRQSFTEITITSVK